MRFDRCVSRSSISADVPVITSVSSSTSGTCTAESRVFAATVTGSDMASDWRPVATDRQSYPVGSLLMRDSPPDWRASPETIDRPRPVPFQPLGREDGSVAFARVVSSMPIPLSAMRMRKIHPAIAPLAASASFGRQAALTIDARVGRGIARIQRDIERRQTPVGWRPPGPAAAARELVLARCSCPIARRTAPPCRSTARRSRPIRVRALCGAEKARRRCVSAAPGCDAFTAFCDNADWIDPRAAAACPAR